MQFFCSGGRLDKHSAASATHAAAKQPLDRRSRIAIFLRSRSIQRFRGYGCRGFLKRWAAAVAAIDACLEANRCGRTAGCELLDLGRSVFDDALVATRCSPSKDDEQSVLVPSE